jgi:hypothetical protein
MNVPFISVMIAAGFFFFIFLMVKKSKADEVRRREDEVRSRKEFECFGRGSCPRCGANPVSTKVTNHSWSTIEDGGPTGYSHRDSMTSEVSVSHSAEITEYICDACGFRAKYWPDGRVFASE